MKRTTLLAGLGAAISGLSCGALTLAEEHRDDSAQGGNRTDPDFAKALPRTRHAFADGLRATGAPAVAISAKFEFDDPESMREKKLSQSIYVAEKGRRVGLQANTLEELSGDATALTWSPRAAPLTGTDLADGAVQLILMSQTRFGLLDIYQRASADTRGTVYSITPRISTKPAARKRFQVQVAMPNGTTRSVAYDLVTGKRLS
jgi:hypothetical protein